MSPAFPGGHTDIHLVSGTPAMQSVQGVPGWRSLAQEGAEWHILEPPVSGSLAAQNWEHLGKGVLFLVSL